MITLRQLASLAALCATAQAWLPDGPKARMTSRGLEMTAVADVEEREPGAGFGAEPVGTAAETRASRRWTPGRVPIRGVNLGSLFIVEPWMSGDAWADIGCTGEQSEFDCVIRLGQDLANERFRTHWEGFIGEGDLNQMNDAGLNMIRIPIGYWMYDAVVDDASERFPRGGLEHLLRICGWASDRGFYIMLELHGAPGAQVAQNSFTGQYASTPGFYNSYNYGRAEEFLGWLTRQVHNPQDNRMRNVGAIGVVNEPTSWDNAVQSLRTDYYPAAYNAIRSVESQMGITANNALHVAFMNTLWGSGDPKQFLPAGHFFTLFEDHRYIKWDGSVPKDHNSYLRDACTNNRSPSGNNENPTIVTEWSISAPDGLENTDPVWVRDGNFDFYKRWFAAAVIGFERHTLGWAFWTWKAQLGDYRWSYKDALDAGVIPANLDSIASSGACDGF